MLKYLLKTPDPTWNAVSPAQAKAENLKLNTWGQQDSFYQTNIAYWF